MSVKRDLIHREIRAIRSEIVLTAFRSAPRLARWQILARFQSLCEKKCEKMKNKGNKLNEQKESSDEEMLPAVGDSLLGTRGHLPARRLDVRRTTVERTNRNDLNIEKKESRKGRVLKKHAQLLNVKLPLAKTAAATVRVVNEARSCIFSKSRTEEASQK